MTETRLFAPWLRSLAGLAALAGLLGLSACGGGSGAPNNVFDAPGPLTVLPASAIAYSGVPIALTVTGGTPPYRAYSSNSGLVPVAQAVAGDTIVVVPGNLSDDTEVTITVQDNPNAQIAPTSTAAVLTVRSAPLVNSLTITPNFADCGTGAICSGQTGTASVTVLGSQGGALSGRQVRFDVVSGPYGIVPSNPSLPVVSTLTVVTDASGHASVIIKANANAPTQFAQLRVTDLTSGQQLLGNFLIQQVTDGSKILSVVPGTAKITGAFKGSCSTGFVTEYFIYGGTPPYRVTSTFPNSIVLSGSPVNTSGGSFRATTNGACVDPLTFSIVDATGRQTTATLSNVEGATEAPVITPPPTATLTAPSAGSCASRTFSVLVADGTPPYNVTVSPSGPTFAPSATPGAPGYVTISALSDGNTYSFSVSDSSTPPQLAAPFTIVCPVP